MGTLDEHIAHCLRESRRSGELQAAPSWGKPLAVDAGFDDTPAELRRPFKILKDAGYVPQEALLMNQIAALRAQLAGLEDDSAPAALALRRRVADLGAALAMRLDRLRSTGSL
ncbi:MAG: DnaJ family domain-containing protein [Rubrivivax sp.]